MQSIMNGKQIYYTKMNSDSNPTFKNGQIIYGKINKLYPNQMAEVQIGNQKILANVDAPLQTGERYLLQVQQNIGNLLLKVLDSEATSNMNGKASATAQQIISHLGGSASGEATELVEFLMKNQLPIKKDTFQLAMQWLKQVDSPKEGLMAIKTMYTQQLPFVEDVFNALFTQAKGESFHGTLQQLLTTINTSATNTETTTQLKAVLESLIVPNERTVLQSLASETQMPDMTNPAVVSAQLKDIAKLLGLQLEHVLANTKTLNSAQLKEELTTLKPLLLTLLHEQQPATVKELADQIVNRITAQQIISQENGPIQNLLLTLPLNIGNYQTDVTLQWSGRKRKDGSIDPDYCRILFYLDLEQLKETVIDMQVQNRVIKISVLNEQSELIQDLAAPFIHTLRNKLEEMDYKLSGILFENTVKKQIVENKQQLLYQTASSYSGVDVRI